MMMRYARDACLTDTIMFLFTVASLCAIVYLVHDFDGVPAILKASSQSMRKRADVMARHSRPGHGVPHADGLPHLAIVIDISWLLIYTVSPWQSSRHLMAKNEHVVLGRQR